MERCPRCGSIFIEWRGDRGCYRCLQRGCRYEWKEWGENGPESYRKIRNVFLKVSLLPNRPLPYVNK